MKAYAIKSKYGYKVRVIELELEERPKTYKVLDSGIGFFEKVISKEEVNKFIAKEEQVICFNIDKGLEVYEQGINDLAAKEVEEHTRTMSRFSLLKSQLKEVRNENSMS